MLTAILNEKPLTIYYITPHAILVFEKRNDYSLTSYQQFYSRICGKLLGNGCMIKQGNSQPNFQFIYHAKDFGWSDYCYVQLKDFLPLSPPMLKRNTDLANDQESYKVQSRTHTKIDVLYDEWYPAGKKVIPFSFLNTYLNEEALAWWYQDKGHPEAANGNISKIILSTDGISAGEIAVLINLLNEKFALQFGTDGQNRMILYERSQIIKLLRLISPWQQEAFRIKTTGEIPARPIAKQTTVHLPSSIQLTNPCMEINEKLSRLHIFLTPDEDIDSYAILYHLFRWFSFEYRKTIAYQIVFLDEHREMLAKVQQQTGMSISELVTGCFM